MAAYRQPQRVPYLGNPVEQPSNTGADKRVLSLLRNSLESKQQREEQMNSQQPILVNHSQQSFQDKVGSTIRIFTIKSVWAFYLLYRICVCVRDGNPTLVIDKFIAFFFFIANHSCLNYSIGNRTYLYKTIFKFQRHFNSS